MFLLHDNAYYVPVYGNLNFKLSLKKKIIVLNYKLKLIENLLTWFGFLATNDEKVRDTNEEAGN